MNRLDAGMWSTLVAIGMTFLGALASYASKILNGEPFSWSTLALQVLVSIFAGALFMLIGLSYGWDVNLIGALCGIAGWSGATIVKIIEYHFIRRINDKIDDRSGGNG